MEKVFRFPDVGEGITEGTIVEVLVKEGQTIKKDAPIANIETDKAIVEIPSPFEGKVLKVNFKKGDIVKVGDSLIVVETGEGGEEMPDLIVPSEKQGEEKSKAKEKLEPKPEEKQKLAVKKHVKASPATRKLARDLGVDLSSITGSGPGGRITDEDVRKAAQTTKKIDVKEESSEVLEKDVEKELEPKKKVTEKKPKSVSEQLFFKTKIEEPLKQSQRHTTPIIIEGEVERIPFKGVRKTISDKMVESKFTAPHVTHIDEADLTELWEVKKKEQKIAAEKQIHLTFLAFVVKAVVAALKKHPVINSSLDEEKQEIILKKYYNIGIAVETGHGLMVPVIKNADKKSILQIAKEIQELAEKARNRALSLEELRGSSFTITNVGSVGGLISTPIINYPETAILGFHRIKERPVVLNGKIQARKMVYLAVSFDHRVIDGAKVALFLKDVIELLEDPARLLVDVV